MTLLYCTESQSSRQSKKEKENVYTPRLLYSERGRKNPLWKLVTNEPQENGRPNTCGDYLSKNLLLLIPAWPWLWWRGTDSSAPWRWARRSGAGPTSLWPFRTVCSADTWPPESLPVSAWWSSPRRWTSPPPLLLPPTISSSHPKHNEEKEILISQHTPLVVHWLIIHNLYWFAQHLFVLAPEGDFWYRPRPPRGPGPIQNSTVFAASDMFIPDSQLSHCFLRNHYRYLSI